MTIRSILGMFATGLGIALAWVVAAELDRRRDRRQSLTELNRWEAEGGNVPDVPSVAPRDTPAAY